MSPRSGLSTMIQMSVATVTEKTLEVKKITRRTAWNRVSRLSASASPSETATMAGTVMSVKRSVFRIDTRKSGSSNMSR
jgi:hypothetical protein